MVVTGALAGASAALLYVTELSRAVGVVLAGVSLAVAAVGGATLRSRRWPPRVVLYALAVTLVLLAGLGVATFIYVLTTANRTAT